LKKYLLADVGNTFTKIRIYENSEYQFLTFPTIKPDGNPDGKQLQDLVSANQIDDVLYSTVVPEWHRIFNNLEVKGVVRKVSVQMKLPFEMKYQTPETLGSDRIALLAAAAEAGFHHHCTLIVSAGTCITFDILHERTYLGGAISPGLAMRAKAMNHFTKALPLVTVNLIDIPVNGQLFIGQDTAQCLWAGSVQSAALEIDQYIDRLKSKFSKLKIYLTGGDANTLEKMIKSDIFARPNMCLDGLNILYKLNA
jgi:type III pantothenate kinase